MTRSNAGWLIVVVLLGLGYPLSYSALRLTHVLTHASYFVSSEGLDAHHFHELSGDDRLRTLYAPLIELELAVHHRYEP